MLLDRNPVFQEPTPFSQVVQQPAFVLQRRLGEVMSVLAGRHTGSNIDA